MAEIRQAGLWKAISIKDVAGPTPANLLPFAEKALVEKLQGRSSNLPSWTTCVSFLGASPIRRCHHHLCPQAKCNCAGCDGCNFSEHAGRDPWVVGCAQLEIHGFWRLVDGIVSGRFSKCLEANSWNHCRGCCFFWQS